MIVDYATNWSVIYERKTFIEQAIGSTKYGTTILNQNWHLAN